MNRLLEVALWPWYVGTSAAWGVTAAVLLLVTPDPPSRSHPRGTRCPT